MMQITTIPQMNHQHPLNKQKDKILKWSLVQLLHVLAWEMFFNTEWSSFQETFTSSTGHWSICFTSSASHILCFWNSCFLEYGTFIAQVMPLCNSIPDPGSLVHLRDAIWSDSENKVAKAWSWLWLTLECCKKIWAFFSQDIRPSSSSFPTKAPPSQLKRKQMLPTITKPKSQRNASVLLLLTRSGPCKGSLAFFSFELADNLLLLEPQSLQVIAIVI